MTTLALPAEELGVNERTLRRAVNGGTLRGSWPTPRDWLALAVCVVMPLPALLRRIQVEEPS